MKKLVPFLCFLAVAAVTEAGVVTTGFDNADGFVTSGINGAVVPGALDPVTVTGTSGFSVTFSGGQQQQAFDSFSYNVGPAAFLFVNGGPGFEGASGNTIASTGDNTGLIEFSGGGASQVSFFAANRGNGSGADVLDVFGVGGGLLGSVDVNATTNNGLGAELITISSSDFGGAAIGSIGVDLPGPAVPGNPPYVLAIDTFSATAVPEPSSFAMIGLVGVGVLVYRRRRSQVELQQKN